MHPYCRCSIAPCEDNKEYDAWLDYVKRGGAIYEWKDIKKFRQSLDISSSDDIIKLNFQYLEEYHSLAKRLDFQKENMPIL